MHLCHNPRVVKEAAALADAGFKVTVLGGFLDTALKRRDEEMLRTQKFAFIPVVDMTRRSRAFSSLRIGKLLYRLTKIENAWQLGQAYPSLAKAARAIDADLYICHMEQALAVGSLLLRDGKRVATDMEDWYSEDLLPQARRHRPIRLLRDLEQQLLRRGAFGICTSHVMAKALANSYNCVQPAVIYNVFPWADRQRLTGGMLDRRDASKPSIYWFSQTLGPERGLEDLVLSLPFINQAVEIHLRGKPSVGGFKEVLEEKIPLEWKDKVFFHSPVHNGELLSRVAEHDIGFAGERPDPPNKDLTVSNKLFHYLLGGLAIVASNTSGQKEISEMANGAIQLYEARNPRSLANAINALLSSPARLKAAKAAAINSAQSDFCWEVQQHVLTELVARNLNSDSDLATAAEKVADMPTG